VVSLKAALKKQKRGGGKKFQKKKKKSTTVGFVTEGAKIRNLTEDLRKEGHGEKKAGKNTERFPGAIGGRSSRWKK